MSCTPHAQKPKLFKIYCEFICRINEVIWIHLCNLFVEKRTTTTTIEMNKKKENGTI